MARRSVEASRALMREEVLRCGRDPIHFIRKYVRIQHPTRGLISFDTFDFQDALVRSYMEHRFNVVLKARQLGATEITAAFCAWLLIFHKNKNILCIATKAETAKNIIRRVKTVIKYLPRWLVISEAITDNKMSLEFDNGSVIKAIASSEDAGRSEAVSLLVVDEAAFINNFDTIWTGLLPTVSAGGRVIMISTPNGVGNVFHKTFVEAEAGQNKFRATKLPWWVHPERIEGLRDDPERPGFKTSPWFREETKNMSARDRAQEHELDFLSSGETFVPRTGLDYVGSTVIEPMFMEHWDRNLHIWGFPAEHTRYLICCDVSRGDSRDYQSFHVFEVDTMLEVAEYYGKIPPDEFAVLACDTGARYNSACLVIENNSYGLAVLEHVKLWVPPHLRQLVQNGYNTSVPTGYPNVYCSERGETMKGEAVDLRTPVSERLILGLNTSGKTRPVILAKLEEYIRGQRITFRSMRFLTELRTFVWNEGKPEALRGYNDDSVMSAALGVFVRDVYLAPNINMNEMNRAIIQSAQIRRVVNTDIPGASKDPRLAPARSLGAFVRPRNPYQMMVGRHMVDLREALERKE